MTITLKSETELRNLLGDNLELQTDNLIKEIAGKTLTCNDFEVQMVTGTTDKIYHFIITQESTNLDVTIPSSWCSSFDLGDNSDNYFCRVCGFTVDSKANYQFEKAKVYDNIQDRYIRPTWGLVITSGEDYRCPVCLSQNSMESVS